MSKELSQEKTLSELTYDRLLALLISGQIPRGTTLQERRLAAMLDISRTPVREALGRLELQGLITRAGGRLVTSSDVPPRQIAEIFDIRRVLEVAAAGLAARHKIRPDRASALIQALQAVADTEEPAPADQLKADEMFHIVVAEAAQNSVLLHTIVNLLRRSQIARWQIVPLKLRESALASLATVDAIQSGDQAMAETLMGQHIDEARGTVLHLLMPGLRIAGR